MQPRSALLMCLLLPLLLHQSALAGDAPRVVIGTTGLTLGNSAVDQRKLYIEQDRALNGRITCLLQDVDTLLAQLHALPPEWQGAAIAEQPVTAELKQLIDLALVNSTELKPMRSELAMYAARTRQAGARMDPMFSVMLMDLPVVEIPPEMKLNDFTMSKVEFGISQTFEGYGKRDLKRGIAHLDELMLQLQTAEMERSIISDVSKLYFKLAGTQSKLRVMDTNIELMQLLLSLAESKYGLGLTSQAEVLNAQVTLTQMERERLDMRKMLAEDQAMLAGMLGHPEGFDPVTLKFQLDYPLPQDLQFDPAQLKQAALDRLPNYQRLKLQQTQQGLMVQMAKREYRPDYTLTLNYEMSWKQRDMLQAGVMVPLQLDKQQNQDAKVQEAYAMQQAVNDSLRDDENKLATAISTKQVELSRLRELIDLDRTGLLPQARLAIDSNIAGYAANMMDLSDLLMAQQSLLNAELALEQNYIEYVAGLADLQIMTAGAFDPAPYLSPSLQLEVPAVVVPDATTEATPRVETPFVDSLQLPPADEPGLIDPAAEADAAPAVLPPAEQPSGGSDFYQPFDPHQGGSHGG